MKKIETIWHHILFQALEGRYKHTQQSLASEFSYSLSTVNHALRAPTQMGAIRKTSKFFVLENFDKLLYYWASIRNVEKDILYKTYVDARIAEIEGMVPPKSIYAGYSAAKKLLGEPPADYSKVYFYSAETDLGQVKARFPLNSERESNMFVLKMPPVMPRYGQITTIPQTFVDIWNFRDWYGKDFIRSLETKIYAILS